MLAVDAVETGDTRAFVLVDPVLADAAILAGLAEALINLLLAHETLVTWHTDADKLGDVIQARALVEARVGRTLPDVLLAPVARETGGAVAAEAPGRVHAFTFMFANVRDFMTLINVFVAETPLPSSRARADRVAVDGRRLAYGCRQTVTRVAGTSVVKMAAQTCFSGRTHAVVISGPVVARAVVVTRVDSAVVDVLLTMVPLPTINTYTQVAALAVLTRGPILT